MSGLARLLLRIARRLMPPDRREWAEAMRAESVYLPSRGAWRWALGCVSAAFKERLRPMNTGDFRISRSVMLIETFGMLWFPDARLVRDHLRCFGPGASRLGHRDEELLTYPGGPYIFAMIVLGSIVGLVGPIGLFLGMRWVVSGRALANRALGYTLIGALLVYALAGAAGWFLGPPGFKGGDPAFSLVFFIMPLAGVAHLMYLARSAQTLLPAAAT